MVQTTGIPRTVNESKRAGLIGARLHDLRHTDWDVRVVGWLSGDPLAGRTFRGLDLPREVKLTKGYTGSLRRELAST